MRERIAVAVAVLVAVSLATLAGFFARVQNSGAGASSAPTLEAPRASVPQAPVTPISADSLRGRMVFDSAGCARCHSVAGVGSPRSPLDGVGARRTAAELRAWTQGAEVLADSLAPSVLRTKEGFRSLKPADLDALVAYLQRLKTR